MRIHQIKYVCCDSCLQGTENLIYFYLNKEWHFFFFSNKRHQEWTVPGLAQWLSFHLWSQGGHSDSKSRTLGAEASILTSLLF